MASEITSRQAAQDLALKMALEIQLDKSMRRIFRDMANEAAVYYKRTHQILDTKKFDVEINATLRQHYRKTSKVFENRLRIDLAKRFKVLEVKKVDDKVKDNINGYIYKRSIEQTSFISKTNSDELVYAFENTNYQAMQDGEYLSADELAEEASYAFEQRALGRSRTIGQTETQAVAEKTKDIEAYALIGHLSEDDVIADGIILRPENITKTWSTILDTRTRLPHAEADDQTVLQDEPFLVDGEELMFPGDDSRGASLENIINCRCNTSRAIELSGLPDYVERPENYAPRSGYITYPYE